MSRYMTFRFDVTTLTARQREILAGSVIAQSEASDFNYEAPQAWADENYPDVKVAEVCHFCGQVIEDGECGGEGEGICTELACVTDFARPGELSPEYGTNVEAYVRDYCAEHGIEDAPVPFRSDGLTYHQQLAYLVREYQHLPQPPKVLKAPMPDLSTLPHQTLVKLIQEIVAEAIAAEDAGDCILSICSRFGVQPNGDLSQLANLGLSQPKRS